MTSDHVIRFLVNKVATVRSSLPPLLPVRHQPNPRRQPVVAHLLGETDVRRGGAPRVPRRARAVPEPRDGEEGDENGDDEPGARECDGPQEKPETQQVQELLPPQVQRRARVRRRDLGVLSDQCDDERDECPKRGGEETLLR